MNDSEKLELLLILEDIKTIREQLDKVEKRVKKIMTGLAPGFQPPKVEAAPASVNPAIGTSIHDSVGTVRTPSAAEIRAHTMEFNERITK